MEQMADHSIHYIILISVTRRIVFFVSSIGSCKQNTSMCVFESVYHWEVVRLFTRHSKEHFLLLLTTFSCGTASSSETFVECELPSVRTAAILEFQMELSSSGEG